MGAGQDDDQRFEKVSASLGRRQFVISCNLQSAPIRFDGALMGLGSPTSLKAEADHRSCSCWASRSAAALELLLCLLLARSQLQVPALHMRVMDA